MQIQVSAQNMALSELKRDFLEMLIRRVLARFANRIERVVVNLGDANGPCSGLVFPCRIRLLLIPGGVVTATAKGASPFVAARIAVQRARRQLGRSKPVSGRRYARVALSRKGPGS